MENSFKKYLFTLLLIIILFTTFIDMWQETGGSLPLRHYLTELLVTLAVIVGIVSLWYENLFLTRELKSVNSELHQSRIDSEKWKNENAELLKGLSTAIDKQFEDWKLSPSEKDVALLLLKGLSLKEVALVRSVSERTVRQQSISIYQKSNLAGRAELSAFFLEDLLK
jgi:DNA-binding CsgD family transcriptional regulator